MAEHQEIFDKATASLPAGYTMRRLRRDDYARGFLTCLGALTWIGDVSESAFQERFDWLATKGADWYYCLVIDDGQKIIGTATFIAERKFIHDLNIVAHVEEVSVRQEHQGKGLGYILITTINALAKAIGAGLMGLDCSDHNLEFYRKCGYSQGGNHMKLSYKQGTGD